MPAGRVHRTLREDAGYFEELIPEQIQAQLAVSLIGPMNLTRAVLPVMRSRARDTS